MLEPTQRVAVIARVPVVADMSVTSLRSEVRSRLGSGAVGVCLEPSRTRGAGPVGAELIAAASELTCTTVAVDGSEVARATSAIDAGAGGLLVARSCASAVRDLAAAKGVFLWMTDSGDAPSAGPRSERLIIEGLVGEFTLRGVTSPGGVRNPGFPDSGGPTSVGAEGSATRACLIPDSTGVADGSIEALTTIAVVGGARLLRTCDVRVVRRCADVAMELVLARAAEVES